METYFALFDYGVVTRQIGDKDKGIQMIKDAAQVAENLFGSDHPRTKQMQEALQEFSKDNLICTILYGVARLTCIAHSKKQMPIYYSNLFDSRGADMLPL